MPPKVKFQKEEIIAAGLNAVREKGIDSLTAREVASRLGVSTRPIFTYYDTMEQLRQDVYESARVEYRRVIEKGLEDKIPFLGVWRQYLRFAKEQPGLYRLLFLTGHDAAADTLRYSQDLVRDSVMRIYKMDAFTADCFFRNIWLTATGFATLIVTDNCPYTEEEMLAIGREISLSLCKTYKEIPGLPYGECDTDAVFRSLVDM